MPSSFQFKVGLPLLGVYPPQPSPMPPLNRQQFNYHARKEPRKQPRKEHYIYTHPYKGCVCIYVKLQREDTAHLGCAISLNFI